MSGIHDDIKAAEEEQTLAEWAKSAPATIKAFPELFEHRTGTKRLVALCEALTAAKAELAALRRFVEEASRGEHITHCDWAGCTDRTHCLPACRTCQAIALLKTERGG